MKDCNLPTTFKLMVSFGRSIMVLRHLLYGRSLERHMTDGKGGLRS
jgi:hypothetical protein